MTEEFGDEAAAATGVSEWAQAGLGNSERDVHRVIKRQGLRLELEFTEMRLGDRLSIDWIRPMIWLKYIVEHNLWFHLAGLTCPNLKQCQNTWSGYWERFFQLNPDFDKPAGFDVQNTAALYIHGDEGRTLKKAALMIMGFQSCLGYGCSVNGRTRKRKADGDIGFQVNYAGHSYTTRFVTNIMSKQVTESSFDMAAEELAKDLSQCLLTGYTYGGVTYRFCVVACKGDWPFLLRAGHLNRHFFAIYQEAWQRSPRQRRLLSLHGWNRKLPSRRMWLHRPEVAGDRTSPPAMAPHTPIAPTFGMLENRPRYFLSA